MRIRRHETIRRLLEAGPVASQEALQLALAQEGIEVAQATLSRDLRELGVVKGPWGYQFVQSDAALLRPIDLAPASSGLPPEPALLQHALSVGLAIGMVVVRTSPGSAGVVALELDRHPPAGVAGTIAGDDTIFVAVNPTHSTESVADEIASRAALARRPA